MELDKKLKEVFRTQDEAFKSYMSITETNWHYDGDGKTVEQAGNTGVFVKRLVMGRVVEFLKEVDHIGMGPKPKETTFVIWMRLDIKTPADGDRRQVVGNKPYFYEGTVDNPADFYSQEVRQMFPKAWEEFKAHRGFIYHSGQWIKSMFVQNLEDQEKANVKSKPSGSH
jgi:hypothetical protein